MKLDQDYSKIIIITLQPDPRSLFVLCNNPNSIHVCRVHSKAKNQRQGQKACRNHRSQLFRLTYSL